MPAKLTVCYRDQPAVETYLFEDSFYHIGRGEDCEVRLLHPSVSRRHAQVTHPKQVWELKDESSRNGTRVNGLKVTRSALHEDAIISLGQLDCLFEAKTAEQLNAILAHDTWRRQQSLLQQPVAEHFIQSLQGQLQNVLSLTGTQRGLILLGHDIDTLTLASSNGFRTSDFRAAEFEGSIGAVTHVMQTQLPMVAMDVNKHDLLSGRESIQRKQISSLACLPLHFKEQLIGAVYTDSKMSDKVLTELDMDILGNLSEQMEATVQALLVQQSLAAIQHELAGDINGTTKEKDAHFMTLCH